LQNVPDPDGPTDIASTFFVEKQEWKNTIREAIDYAIEQESAPEVD
jgi:stalled ribosome rescue protein Dom34